MPVIESSIPAVLAERAQRQPDDIAYTFIDYEVDPGGVCRKLDVVAGLPESAGRRGGTVAVRLGW